jgi:ketosteroid isomerase-like protein
MGDHSMSQVTQQDIQPANRIFELEVAGKRNVDALDRVYTTDARILPPGAPMVSGRENIKAFWRSAIEAMNVRAVKLETVSFEALADTGIEIGRATLEFAAPEVPMATVKYVVIWKREDGMWKWHIDIWNPDA